MRIGLGALAGAVCPSALHAQVTPRDTTRPPVVQAPIPAPPADPLDTAAARQRADSVRADSVRADTLRAPLARAEAPMLPEPGRGWQWDRQALFATGALTLGELLDRIPGAVSFRTSWIHSPETVAFLGEPAAVRVFLDGVELDQLDPRNGAVLDLDQVQLWPLEEVRVERGARELRVHLRSWRYDRTIPNTRFDVGTGDQATNMYRGFLAKRYKHGAAFQAGVQQFSTTVPYSRSATTGQYPGGRSLAIMLRAGWAKGPWSVDGFLLRDGRTRNTEPALTLSTGDAGLRVLGTPVADSIPALRAVRSDAYLRGSYGDPENGPWLQAVAATSRFGEATGQEGTRLGPLLTHEDSARGAPLSDTTRSRAQYVLAGGLTRWGARLSATARTRVFEGRTVASPVVRASFDTRFGAVSTRAERNGFNHAASVEAGISAIPLSFITLAAVAERTQGANDGTPSGTAARAEAGVRIHEAWVSAGALYRDSTLVAVPWVYYSDYTPGGANHPSTRIAVGQARGAFVAVQGKLFRDAGLDATVTQWDSPDLLRPQLVGRADFFLRTRWLSRFPNGEFGINANVIFDFRSAATFPTFGATPAEVGTTTVRGTQNVSTLLELHVRSAYIFWQYRNIVGISYALVPGYGMPRATNLYGVRWDFYN